MNITDKKVCLIGERPVMTVKENQMPGHFALKVPDFYLPGTEKMLFILLFAFLCLAIPAKVKAQADSSRHKRVVSLTDSIIAVIEHRHKDTVKKPVQTAVLPKTRYRTVAPYNIFLNHEYDAYLDEGIEDTAWFLHTIFRPMTESDVNQFVDIDSLHGYDFPAEKKSWLYRKLFQENLFIIYDTTSKFYCTVDPLFNFQGSLDYSDSNKKYYQNSRGILIQGSLGNKFAFSSTFWENQADFPYYLNQYVQQYGIAPGSGRTKAFGTDGYDFSMSEAYLSYSPSEHFNFQGGYGKNFIGDGYRSLLLSDNSLAYPYFRTTITVWHIQYTMLYALFTDPFADPSIMANNEGLFQRKAAVFQYFSWNFNSKTEGGFFASMISTPTTPSNHLPLNAGFFDPIIGVNALTYGLSSTDNVAVGSTLKYKFSEHFMAYGQLFVDDFPYNFKLVDFQNRTGHQVGVKYYRTFGKFWGEFQLEYNEARPYTYGAQDSLQNYSNYNQPLADPLGANFREVIGFIRMRYRHFSLNIEADYAQQGLDTAHVNFGSNVFLPLPANYPNHNMLSGNEATLLYMDAHISYLLNPHTNMNFTIGVSYRTYNTVSSIGNEPPMTLFYIGFRTSIENVYNDF